MADHDTDESQAAKKPGKGGLLIGLVLACVGGGAGFALTSGVLGGHSEMEASQPSLSEDLAFVPIEPMTVAVGKPSDRRYLRFRAELEVAREYKSDVEGMLPRVVDVLNTYLQSLEMEDIEAPSSLLALRSQMRRRVDLVVGGNRVNDLLVMEFVVN